MDENLTPAFGTVNYIPKKGLTEEQVFNGYIRSRSIQDIWLEFPWSASVWSRGYRLEDNFLFSDYCVLDFDETMTLAQATENTFCDYDVLIGLTQNHQLPKNGKNPHDRFRVVIPWEKRITCLDTYRFNMEKNVERLDADAKCKDGAHFFWPCRELYLLQRHGEPMDVYTPTTAWVEAQRLALIESVREIKYLTGTARAVLRGNIPPGERNNTLYMGAKDLLKTGMTGEEILGEVRGKKFYLEADHKDQRGYEKTIKSAAKKLAKDRRRVKEQWAIT